VASSSASKQAKGCAERRVGIWLAPETLYGSDSLFQGSVRHSWGYLSADSIPLAHTNNVLSILTEHPAVIVPPPFHQIHSVIYKHQLTVDEAHLYFSEYYIGA
jgi:hypothetical protein